MKIRHLFTIAVAAILIAGCGGAERPSDAADRAIQEIDGAERYNASISTQFEANYKGMDLKVTTNSSGPFDITSGCYHSVSTVEVKNGDDTAKTGDETYCRGANTAAPLIYRREMTDGEGNKGDVGWALVKNESPSDFSGAVTVLSAVRDGTIKNAGYEKMPDGSGHISCIVSPALFNEVTGHIQSGYFSIIEEDGSAGNIPTDIYIREGYVSILMDASACRINSGDAANEMDTSSYRVIIVLKDFDAVGPVSVPDQVIADAYSSEKTAEKTAADKKEGRGRISLNGHSVYIDTLAGEAIVSDSNDPSTLIIESSDEKGCVTVITLSLFDKTKKIRTYINEMADGQRKNDSYSGLAITPTEVIRTNVGNVFFSTSNYKYRVSDDETLNTSEATAYLDLDGTVFLAKVSKYSAMDSPSATESDITGILNRISLGKEQ